MSRAQRLLTLIDVLRRHRRPVAGHALAEELGISLRSVYRDIATLQAQGAEIDGAAGVGFLLKPGFMLPPLMFDEDEIEALALGARWVAGNGDGTLAAAGRAALAKVLAVLPADLREKAELSPLLVGPQADDEGQAVDTETIRTAIRSERKLAIRYRDRDGAETERTIWPFALGYFSAARVVAAWCERRQGFRHFRTDRLMEAAMLDDRYPKRRTILMAEWRRAEGIDAG